MARRGGLGQRGINLLIPDESVKTPGKDKNEAADSASDKAASRKKKGSDASVKNESSSVKRGSFESGIREESQDFSETVIVKNEPLLVKIDEIEPNRSQPRKNFDEDSLKELADSILTYGVIEPLIVQKKDDYYEIIAGERRWRAARIAGIKELPVVVRDYTDREVMEISLIENIQREDLNPIEEANAYRRLIEEYHLKQEELAEQVGVSRRTVSRWETGSNMPDLDVLMELSDFYSVDLREILNGERKSEQMNQEMKETVLQVADYSNEEKARLLNRIHWLFIAGLVGIIVFLVIYFTGLDSAPIFDMIAGLGLGIAFGMIIVGVIFTSRYAARIREFKLRLLGKRRDGI